MHFGTDQMPHSTRTFTFQRIFELLTHHFRQGMEHTIQPCSPALHEAHSQQQKAPSNECTTGMH